MASTNKTANYELSQFVETDRPAWLTDYNGDMRTIDSTMKAISDVASGASGSISELADRMSTAEGNISTNTNDISALDARADALEAGAQSTAGTIAGIQTEQITQNAGIEAATELGYNLARPYDSASTYAVGAYVLFQNTLYKCITAVSTGEAFDPTKWLAIKATDEIAAGGYTLPVASASQLGGVKVGNGLTIDESGLLSGSPTLQTSNNIISLSDTHIRNATGTLTCNSTGYLLNGNIKILNISVGASGTGINITTSGNNNATATITFDNTSFVPSNDQTLFPISESFSTLNQNDYPNTLCLWSSNLTYNSTTDKWTLSLALTSNTTGILSIKSCITFMYV